MIKNELFLQKAEALKPLLNQKEVFAESDERPLKSGDTVCFDFGRHMVGYVTFSFSSEGSHPDAPAWVEVKAAERIGELAESIHEYHGWISPSWVQQAEFHVDDFPSEIALPRRYSFRYLQIKVLGISDKYRLVVKKVKCTAVSSARDERLLPYETEDEELSAIDRTACLPLHDCMQDVFEDGPKRDRRLWMGDLRLQALANYVTYRQNDLVLRCLYLFAGDTLPGAQIGASVFVTPEPEADDIRMFDYSMLFVRALLDYYEETGDEEVLRELWPVALRQIEVGENYLDENGLIRDSDEIGWCFLDWDLRLNKQVGAQGVYLYALRAAKKMAGILGDGTMAEAIEQLYEKRKQTAVEAFFDKEKGVFQSGKDRQISWASQIWMVLGGAADISILDRVKEIPDAVGIVTPYLYHYYVEALIDAGRKEQALQVIRSYWGGMIGDGADTFWELYNPENPDESPYGGTIVNSYCHAWSCTPAYFLRKYF